MKERTPSSRLAGPYLLALGVDTTIGLGIFFLPGKLAASWGERAFLLFPLGGLALGVIALVFARLSTLTSRNGGPYLYASLAFGPRWAFPLGWSDWIGTTLGVGAMGGVLAGVLSSALHFPQAGSRWIAATILVLFSALNARGVRTGGRLMASLTLLKVVPLLALAAAGVYFRLSGRASSWPVTVPTHTADTLLMTLFLLQGFELVPAIAGEARWAENDVPRAILGTLIFSVVLYTVLQWGLSRGPAVGADRPLSAEAIALWGPSGGIALDGAALLSLLGLIAGRLFAAPRYLLPLCEDRFFPSGWAARSERGGSPRAAIAITTLIALPVCWLAGLDEMVAVSGLGIALQYALSAFSLFVWRLRKRGRTEAGQAGDIALSVLGFSLAVFFIIQVPLMAWKWLAVANVLGVFLLLGCRLLVVLAGAQAGFSES